MQNNRQKPDKNRATNGRFKPGNAANPNGRPKGSKNKTTKLIEALLEDEAEVLTQGLIRRAKAGNSTALAIIFSTLLPRARDRTVTITALPNEIVAAHTAVIAAVCSGDISPSEGQTMANLLDLKRKAEEHAEFAARLSALEARITQNQN